MEQRVFFKVVVVDGSRVVTGEALASLQFLTKEAAVGHAKSLGYRESDFHIEAVDGYGRSIKLAPRTPVKSESRISAEE